MQTTTSVLRGSILAALLVLSSACTPAFAAPVQNIVLVHGAWVDGSGWRPVYDILITDGYTVTVVQEPLTSLADDVNATKQSLDLQTGPVILVGHSYGGSVITEAGVHPNVVGLVYVAASMPDVGENEGALEQGMPSATAQQPGAIKQTKEGFTYLNPADFYQDFAADLPREQADFESRSQILTAATNFTTPISAAAWRTKPSWAIVAGADRIINHGATRSNSRAPAIRSTSRGRRMSRPSSRTPLSMRRPTDVRSVALPLVGRVRQRAAAG
jgi:pimeloyl-ACP methyl ester carboxylesterase